MAKQIRSTKQQATRSSVLLSGGNPQIAKAEGNAPVQAYIAAVSWVTQAAALPGWIP